METKAKRGQPGHEQGRAGRPEARQGKTLFTTYFFKAAEQPAHLHVWKEPAFWIFWCMAEEIVRARTLRSLRSIALYYVCLKYYVS